MIRTRREAGAFLKKRKTWDARRGDKRRNILVVRSEKEAEVVHKEKKLRKEKKRTIGRKKEREEKVQGESKTISEEGHDAAT